MFLQVIVLISCFFRIEISLQLDEIPPEVCHESSYCHYTSSSIIQAPPIIYFVDLSGYVNNDIRGHIIVFRDFGLTKNGKTQGL